ncbi:MULTISPECIES: hypothetical protein [unclassified Roseitalea]|uniref:hypothetical protein n=1 Tax=unclassified Roseitalea TaxID=2639107 RepID=UPI00273E8D15|nr:MULTISPECIES: hypothetical protein [unclassified Roseitalea]
MAHPAGWTMLIIEDKLLIAMNIEQTALDLGAGKVTILRPAEALEFMPGADFAADIAVVDYRAADGRRRELLGLVADTGATLVIVTTDHEGMDDPLLDGARIILRKPFSDADLRDALVRALSR